MIYLKLKFRPWWKILAGWDRASQYALCVFSQQIVVNNLLLHAVHMMMNFPHQSTPCVKKNVEYICTCLMYCWLPNWSHLSASYHTLNIKYGSFKCLFFPILIYLLNNLQLLNSIELLSSENPSTPTGRSVYSVRQTQTAIINNMLE